MKKVFLSMLLLSSLSLVGDEGAPSADEEVEKNPSHITHNRKTVTFNIDKVNMSLEDSNTIEFIEAITEVLCEDNNHKCKKLLSLLHEAKVKWGLVEEDPTEEPTSEN